MFLPAQSYSRDTLGLTPTTGGTETDMKTPTLALSSFFLAAGLSAGEAGGPPLYRFLVLQHPPGAIAVAPSALNDSGMTVGSFFNGATGFFDGLVWDADGVPTVLSDAHGFAILEGIGILSDGTIVGSGSLLSSMVPHASVIAPDGAVTLLPSLAGDAGVVSAAFARNASGLVVGRSALVPSPFWLSVANDAAIWEEGEVTSIGTLGGFFAEARDVNDNDLVIGRSNTATSDFARGFVWDPELGMREILPAEPGGLGHVSGLDQHDRIVGSATLGGTLRACLWPGPDEAPQLLPQPPGVSSSAATAIDSAGRIVGSASTSGQTRAVLWMDGEVHDLNALLEEPLPFLLTGAADLNEAGQILVRSEPVAELGIFDLILTPVPPLLAGEPASISLSSGGAQELRLDAGPPFAGVTYLVLGSLSGTAPGLPLGGLVLPLNPDTYLVFSLTNANNPPFEDTFGQLDRDGRAQAAFALPAGTSPGLAGLQLHHAYAVLDVSGPVQTLLVSNAVPLDLIP
jgi:probable HAF family extracellular repeat protein